MRCGVTIRGGEGSDISCSDALQTYSLFRTSCQVHPLIAPSEPHPCFRGKTTWNYCGIISSVARKRVNIWITCAASKAPPFVAPSCTHLQLLSFHAMFAPRKQKGALPRRVEPAIYPSAREPHTAATLALTSALCLGGLHCMYDDSSIVSRSTHVSVALLSPSP